MSTISPHTALVYVMVVVSASDRKMPDSELRRIGEIVRTAPVFSGYDPDSLIRDARNCTAILQQEDEGLDAVVGLVREAIPTTHLDTAYALACEVAAADARFTREEIRILELIHIGLGIDRLRAAAIELATEARLRGLQD